MAGSTRSAAQRQRQAVVTAVAFVLIGVVVGITWLINNSGSEDDGTRTVAVSTPSKVAPSKVAPPTATPTSEGASKKASATRRTTLKGTAPTSTAPTNTAPTSRGFRASAANPAIPAHVLRTLAYIDAGEWPEAANAPGTKGGVTFRNNEGLLPRTDSGGRRVTYREWDVNPKAPNRGRDAERIVTGSDGSAWYTADHYRTFVKIRGPS
ncbi:ribonuclease domain-containing protein [Gordonia aurantiaca]|uniref:ribonuclease domain-containing protein n=1 Tax=Gordonia sp. B21 TaxID=3151852 RepID=UPI003265F02C